MINADQKFYLRGTGILKHCTIVFTRQFGSDQIHLSAVEHAKIVDEVLLPIEDARTRWNNYIADGCVEIDMQESLGVSLEALGARRAP